MNMFQNTVVRSNSISHVLSHEWVGVGEKLDIFRMYCRYCCHHGVMDSIESVSQGAERKATKMEIGGSPCFRAPWLFMMTRIRYTRQESTVKLLLTSNVVTTFISQPFATVTHALNWPCVVCVVKIYIYIYTCNVCASVSLRPCSCPFVFCRWSEGAYDDDPILVAQQSAFGAAELNGSCTTENSRFL